MSVVTGKAVEMTVGGRTSVHNLAVSISKTVQEGYSVRLVCIGANAVNQAAKAAAKSSSFLAPVGKYVTWKVYFTDRQLSLEDLEEARKRGEEKPEKLSALVFETWIV